MIMSLTWTMPDSRRMEKVKRFQHVIGDRGRCQAILSVVCAQQSLDKL
jgi:hypothetical protein